MNGWEQEPSKTASCTPQGRVVSPCLSNVFLHHVLDIVRD